MSGLKLVWGLLAAYFAVAATICTIGAFGITRRKTVLVRFYRDYAIADLVFTGVGALLATYAAFRTELRALFCEELERQPAFVRDMGLSLENCELWFERAVLFSVMAILIIIVIRVSVPSCSEWCFLCADDLPLRSTLWLQCPTTMHISPGITRLKQTRRVTNVYISSPRQLHREKTMCLYTHQSP